MYEEGERDWWYKPFISDAGIHLSDDMRVPVL
jgi:hypothetical protein